MLFSNSLSSCVLVLKLLTFDFLVVLKQGIFASQDDACFLLFVSFNFILMSFLQLYVELHVLSQVCVFYFTLFLDHSWEQFIFIHILVLVFCQFTCPCCRICSFFYSLLLLWLQLQLIGDCEILNEPYTRAMVSSEAQLARPEPQSTILRICAFSFYSVVKPLIHLTCQAG